MVARKAEGLQILHTSGGRNQDRARQRKNPPHQPLLESKLPGRLRSPASQAVRIRYEKDGSAIPFCRCDGNPRSEIKIAGENGGIKATLANQPPHTGIEQSEEASQSRNGRAIRQVDPRVALQHGCVPGNFHAEFRVDLGFRALQRAVRDLEIETRILRHSAKEWRRVLNHMRRQDENTSPPPGSDALGVCGFGRSPRHGAGTQPGETQTFPGIDVLRRVHGFLPLALIPLNPVPM